jgi:LysR family hydrogen peroxide-inducible transcriptional activator
MPGTATHPFTLRQLQYAAAVAETLSFRRAAERCGVSQPSLSAQLAALESALGTRLFERTRRRVLLAAGAEEMLQRARRVLVEADDLGQAAKRPGDPLAGTIRAGVIPTISPYLLPSAVPALRKRCPRLMLVWVEDKTKNLVEQLRGGALDAAVLALEADIGDVDREIIGKDPFVLAAARSHPLGRARTPLEPKELRETEMLLLDDGHCLRDQALAFCSRSRVREGSFRATSLPTLAQMVAGGAGVTLLPSLAVPLENRGRQLRVRRFRDPAPARTLALVFRRGTPRLRALQEVAAALREAHQRLAS